MASASRNAPSDLSTMLAGDGEHSQVNAEDLAYISTLISIGNKRSLLKDLKTRHPSDIAQILGFLSADQRADFVTVLGRQVPSEALAELDPNIRDEMLEYIDTKTLAAHVAKLDSDDAVFVLENIDDDVQSEVLDYMKPDARFVLERSLEYPENTAGRLMQAEFVAVPPSWTVGRAIDYLRDDSDLPDDFLEIFIVSPQNKPLGVVKLNQILCAQRDTMLDTLLNADFTIISAMTDREEVGRQFELYNLVSAAVTDEHGRLLGMIVADDVFEVIREAADEDILRLGGAGDARITDSILRAVRARFSWLLINFATAIAASVVIGFFDASIERMVALAVLMPIVASMGGNAGTQTLTIAVRGLATKQVTTVNVRRIVFRELGIGIVNGLIFAGVASIIGGLWFRSVSLGVILGLAMIVTLLFAALAGVLIPIGLERMKVDPALASGVFVTTVTDVIGFLSFLGFATLFLIL